MLRKDPKILHISCHGIVNKKETINGISSKNQNEESFLLFEGKEGDGRLLSFAKIKSLVKKIIPNLDIVFVAACHSLKVGEIFQKCGAKHVICVEEDKKVLDDAVLVFTKTFYSELLSGKNVCESYRQAIASVKFIEEKKEGEIFVLLTQDTSNNS